jgi:hypothetical protein
MNEGYAYSFWFLNALSTTISHFSSVTMHRFCYFLIWFWVSIIDYTSILSSPHLIQVWFLVLGFYYWLYPQVWLFWLWIFTRQGIILSVYHSNVCLIMPHSVEDDHHKTGSHSSEFDSGSFWFFCLLDIFYCCSYFLFKKYWPSTDSIDLKHHCLAKWS